MCRDFNFEFIKWPQGDFKGRGILVASDKIQASNLLDLCKCYDLQNISLLPTRQNNVLDLLCTNSDSISYRDMMVNSNLSDHNLVFFDIDIKNSEAPELTRNPYDYRIFEYDFSKEDQAWEDFYGFPSS